MFILRTGGNWLEPVFDECKIYKNSPAVSLKRFAEWKFSVINGNNGEKGFAMGMQFCCVDNYRRK